MEKAILVLQGHLGITNDLKKFFLKERGIFCIEGRSESCAESVKTIRLTGMDLQAIVVYLDATDGNLAFDQLIEALGRCRDHYEDLSIIILIEKSYIEEMLRISSKVVPSSIDRNVLVAAEKMRERCIEANVSWLLFLKSPEFRKQLVVQEFVDVLEVCIAYPECTFYDKPGHKYE